MEPIVVAIDGPAGSGKGTVARKAAEYLGLTYLDTGSIYRAVAWAVLNSRGNSANEQDAVGAAEANRFVVTGPGRIEVNGKDVSEDIRKEAASRGSSQVAQWAGVREVVNRVIRQYAADHGGGVIEGRDTTTAVFPDALVKFYILASVEVRALRRTAADGRLVTMEELEERDRLDMTRELAPLQIADDAIIIDSTNLSIEDVVDIVFNKTKLAMMRLVDRPRKPNPWFAV